MRCLALDGVVGAFNRQTSHSEQEAYAKRVEDGKSAANKLSKMFWWLQPSVPVANGDNTHIPPGMSAHMHAQGNASGAAALNQAHHSVPRPTHNRHRSASFGGATLPPAPQPQALPAGFGSFSAGMPPAAALRFGGLPAHPGINVSHLNPMHAFAPPTLGDNQAGFLPDFDEAQYQAGLAQAAQLQQLIQQLSYLN